MAATRGGIIRTRGRQHAGQQLVELALVLPILLLVSLGVLDLGRSFYTYIALTNAAREAARYAAVRNLPASSAQVTQELGAVSGCATTPTFGGGASVVRGQPYTVTVTCQFQLVTPFIGAIVGAGGAGNRITIGSNATFVID